MIAQIQRIMAIPLKRFARPLLGFLSQSEMQALLQAMDDSWTAQPDAKAPRRTFSQVDEKSLSFHFATRRSFRHSVGSSDAVSSVERRRR